MSCARNRDDYRINHHGFTMPEVILVSAIIAILVALMASNLLAFLNDQKEKDEKALMLEIERSAKAFLAQEERIPSDASTMGADFATTGNLSASQIMIDTWGRPRIYASVEKTIPYKYADLTVHQFYIVSLGADGCVGDTSICYTESPDNTSVVSSKISEVYPTSDFEEVETDGDDLIVKVSDVQQRKDLYQKAVDRLETLSEALERYAKIKYYEDVANGVADAENLIYYPPSSAMSLSLFGSNVKTDTGNALSALGSSASVLNNTTTITSRLIGMRALTKILNVPESLCCNPMKKSWIDSSLQEEPFFYYSYPMIKLIDNPTIRTSHCDLYPAAVADQLAARKLGARISVEEDICGK